MRKRATKCRQATRSGKEIKHWADCRNWK